MSFQNSSLYEKRLELYNDPDFDRKYYIPLDKRQEFLRNKEFDVEYYRMDNIKERRKQNTILNNQIIDEYYNLQDTLEMEVIENFVNSKGFNKKREYNMFYKNKFYIDDDTREYIKTEVIDILKEKYENVEDVISNNLV